MTDKELIEKWRSRHVGLILIQTSLDADKVDMRAIITIGDTVHFMTNEDCYTTHEINTKINVLLRENKLERICNV